MIYCLTSIRQVSILSPMTKQPTFTIKAVAKKTGLSPHVIRVWERRYQAVTPSRTDSNRRLYSPEEVERLELLHQATQEGHSIGAIANLSRDELTELVGDSGMTIPASSTDERPKRKPSGASASSLLEACIKAVRELEPRSLEQNLMRASSVLSLPVLFEQVVAPFLQKVGEFWADGSFRVMNEHMASAVLKSFLNNLRSAMLIPDGAPRAIITTPVAQLHELGALLVTVLAASQGWDVTYLGPNLPATEIAAAVESSQAKIVCLSIVYPGEDLKLTQDLQRLRKLLPGSVKILVGGRAALTYQKILIQIGAVILTDLSEFRQKLSQIV